MVQGQPGQKVHESPSQSVAKYNHPSYSAIINKKITVQAGLGKNPTKTYLKNG
jgi:hypothetical protein